jgi:hypothetical protein
LEKIRKWFSDAFPDLKSCRQGAAVRGELEQEPFVVTPAGDMPDEPGNAVAISHAALAVSVRSAISRVKLALLTT